MVDGDRYMMEFKFTDQRMCGTDDSDGKEVRYYSKSAVTQRRHVDSSLNRKSEWIEADGNRYIIPICRSATGRTH